MPADLVHLVRHGEVHNPKRVLYGRLEGYGLSELGHRMAEASARSLGGHPITALYCSPLQRTRESAAPWQEAFGLEPHIDERLIEPMNRFEGKRMDRATLMNPKHWPWMVNPSRPSWGEPFTSIAARMLAAMTDAHARTEGGEVVTAGLRGGLARREPQGSVQRREGRPGARPAPGLGQPARDERDREGREHHGRA